MTALDAVPLLDSLCCDRLLSATAAVAISAPLAGIAGAQLAGARHNPRRPAGW